jgi:hypothetical protein
MTRYQGGERHLVRPFCSDHCTRHLPLGLKALRHLLAVHAGREAVAPRAHASGDRTTGGEHAWRVSRRCEPWHAPLAPAGRLGAVCGPVRHSAVPAVFDTRPPLASSRPIARRLIRDDGPRGVGHPRERLREGRGGRVRVSPTAHQAIEDVPRPIHRAPAVMPRTPHAGPHRTHTPCVTPSRAPMPSPVRLDRPARPAL